VGIANLDHSRQTGLGYRLVENAFFGNDRQRDCDNRQYHFRIPVDHQSSPSPRGSHIEYTRTVPVSMELKLEAQREQTELANASH
jgi:hypothetical protein